MIYTVDIPGKPVPWARPRKGRRGRWFNTPHSEAHRAVLGTLLRAARIPPFVGAVRVDMDFVFRRQRKGENPDVWLLRSVRPDADNLAKLVLEALEDVGIVEDDKQCHIGGAWRWYGCWREEPFTRVRLQAVDRRSAP